MGACENSRRKVVFSDLVVNILAVLWHVTKRFCYLWSQSAVMHQRPASILHCSSAASQPPASRFPPHSCVCWLALPSKDFAQATGSSFARADRELEALNRYLMGAGGWKPSSSPPVAGTALTRDSLRRSLQTGLRLRLCLLFSCSLSCFSQSLTSLPPKHLLNKSLVWDSISGCAFYLR